MKMVADDILDYMFKHNLAYYRDLMKDELGVSYKLLDDAHNYLRGKGLLKNYQAMHGIVEDMPLEVKRKFSEDYYRFYS